MFIEKFNLIKIKEAAFVKETVIKKFQRLQFLEKISTVFIEQLYIKSLTQKKVNFLMHVICKEALIV